MKTLKEKELQKEIEEKLDKDLVEHIFDQGFILALRPKTTSEILAEKIDEYLDEYLKLKGLELSDMFDETKAVRINKSSLRSIKLTASKSKAGFKILYEKSIKPSKNYHVYINADFALYVCEKVKKLAIYKKLMKGRK